MESITEEIKRDNTDSVSTPPTSIKSFAVKIALTIALIPILLFIYISFISLLDLLNRKFGIYGKVYKPLFLGDKLLFVIYIITLYFSVNYTHKYVNVDSITEEIQKYNNKTTTAPTNKTNTVVKIVLYIALVPLWLVFNRLLLFMVGTALSGKGGLLANIFFRLLLLSLPLTYLLPAFLIHRHVDF